VRVNIIGRGEDWEEGYEAPGEHWAINYFDPMADILFDMHAVGTWSDNDRKNAAICDIPIIGLEEYPIETICAEFKTDFFASSVDYLIALAIIWGASEIHLYGINMDDPDHYTLKCGADFWLGVAKGRGVDVVIHGDSTLMTTENGLQYGYLTPMNRVFKWPYEFTLTNT
jgi:hypothetical protein